MAVRDRVPIRYLFIGEAETAMTAGKTIASISRKERSRPRLQAEDVGGEILAFAAIGHQTLISKLPGLGRKVLVADHH